MAGVVMRVSVLPLLWRGHPKLLWPVFNRATLPLWFLTIFYLDSSIVLAIERNVPTFFRRISSEENFVSFEETERFF